MAGAWPARTARPCWSPVEHSLTASHKTSLYDGARQKHDHSVIRSEHRGNMNVSQSAKTTAQPLSLSACSALPRKFQPRLIPPAFWIRITTTPCHKIIMRPESIQPEQSPVCLNSPQPNPLCPFPHTQSDGPTPHRGQPLGCSELMNTTCFSCRCVPGWLWLKGTAIL